MEMLINLNFLVKYPKIKLIEYNKIDDKTK